MADLPLRLAGATGQMPATHTGVRLYYSASSDYSDYVTAVTEAAVTTGVRFDVRGYSKAVVTMVQEHSGSGTGWDKVYLDDMEQPDSVEGGTFDLSGVSEIVIKGFTPFSGSGRWLTNRYTVSLS